VASGALAVIISARTGNNFDLTGIAGQDRWGDDL
jgi:hypothetical protein